MERGHIQGDLPASSPFSVNNLTSDLPSTQQSFQGHTVAPRTADIVVVGTCGRSKRTLRVVAQRGFSSLRSVSAVGRIVLSGDVEVDGVKSLLPPEGETEPEPAPGGLMSKHRSTSPTAPSISWDGSGTFEMGDLSELETAAPETGGDAFSSNLRALFPDQIADNSAADTIPDIDVAGKVSAGMASPAAAPGGAVLTQNLYLDSQGSVNGNLTLTGDIVLTEGSLYVNGDLTLNGGIKGRGAIYVDGDVTMLGGNTVVQSGEPNGVALLVGGDATFQGIDAEGYLAFLASSDTAIDNALTDVVSTLTHYSTTPGHHYGTGLALTRKPGGLPDPGDGVWVSPIRGPNGRHVMGYDSAYLPALILAIKDTSLHLTDPRAKKVVSALEEMTYHFRDNDISIDMTGRELDDRYQIVESGVTLDRPTVEALRIGPWDDESLPHQFRTHSYLQYGLGGADGLAYSEARRLAYLANNPLDFSFLGNSTFQGIVYTRGNLDASQGFQLIGGLIALGDVSLTAGSRLIFNEEYRDLLGTAVPIGILHFEEI
jgi:hypothetical protein